MHTDTSMYQARYRWTLLRAGRFRLDGGSMFGLIPRTVWSRAAAPDDRGRVAVQHNAILLERIDAPGAEDPGAHEHAPSLGGGSRFALIEVGTGDKLDDKSRDIFSLEQRDISAALAEVGRRPEDIGAVVVSHLHFDHAGGLTRLCRDGEAPDWTGPAGSMAGSRPDHGVKLTFPYAVVFSQRQEWEDALANRSVMTRTYFKDHLEPIRDRIFLVDSPPPFAPDYIPGRDDVPFSSILYRETFLPGLPGVSVFRVPGHTWGQQAVKFTDEMDRTVVFTPDVLPTVNHVGAAYSLGYDVEPYTSMISRRWFLSEAASRDWLLVLDHEPGNPCQHAVANSKGWFDLVPETNVRGDLS
ncbi:MAG: MBL fold metallo-hydrolase [Phycisphaerales bacterium]